MIRRRFIRSLPLLAILPWSLRAVAALPATPAQMPGPFYPLQPDPAAGNDLATTDGRTRAQGTPTRCSSASAGPCWAVSC